jgi:hypothetical protein
LNTNRTVRVAAAARTICPDTVVVLNTEYALRAIPAAMPRKARHAGSPTFDSKLLMKLPTPAVFRAMTRFQPMNERASWRSAANVAQA